MKKLLTKIKELELEIKENEPLKKYTTFRIGGPAKVFLEVEDENKLSQILKIAKEEKLNFFIIGGGTNLLISGKGFDGLVIKLKPGELEFNQTEVKVGAGYLLTLLLNQALDKGLVGMEFASGIPGTVGGAIKGNAGTFGEAMDKIVVKVNYLDENLESKTLTNQECKFSYRSSIFENHKDWIIISALLKLEEGDTEASRKVIKERLQYRLDNHPVGAFCGGSFFKNIIYTEEIAGKLRSLNIDLPEKFKKYKKIPAAFVIEELGLKGQQIGQAQMSEKHANYLLNLGEATADEVIQLASFIKQQVRDKAGIQLEEEVRYVGF